MSNDNNIRLDDVPSMNTPEWLVCLALLEWDGCYFKTPEDAVRAVEAIVQMAKEATGFDAVIRSDDGTAIPVFKLPPSKITDP